jgi:cell division protein FtsW (lipid II flippase)
VSTSTSTNFLAEFDDSPRFRHPTRIGELLLLLLALTASIGAFAMVGQATQGHLPDEFWVEAASMAGIALLLHIVIRLRAPWADQTLMPAVVLLNGVGLAMIQRIEIARPTGGADVIRNTQWTAISVLLACLVMFFLRDHRILRRFTYTSMIVGLALLMSPMIPGVGREINGARIWINIAGFSLQPGEFAKLFLAIFFAGYFYANRDTLALAGPKILGLQLPRLRDLGPIIIVWAAAIAVLVMQSDMGMSLLLFGMFVAMLWLATQRSSWVLLGVVMAGVGGYGAVTAFPHVARRFDVWLDAMNSAVIDRVGGSGQLVSGMFSLAGGGLFGTGWGQGHPYLTPLSFSDFIYTSIGEELGLTGMLAILVIFLIVIERGLRTAILVRDGFGKLLAGGLSFMLAIQVFTIIGGVTRLIPLTGLVTPFMAQGGTAMMSNWILVAFLLIISNAARQPSSTTGLGQIAIDDGFAAVKEPAAEAIPVGRSADDAARVLATPPPLDPRDATHIINLDLPPTAPPPPPRRTSRKADAS